MDNKVVKIISIAGTVLGLVGTLVSSWAQQKTIDDTIAREVEKALNNKNI